MDLTGDDIMFIGIHYATVALRERQEVAVMNNDLFLTAPGRTDLVDQTKGLRAIGNVVALVCSLAVCLSLYLRI
jgi:hypothetical protein